MRRWPRPRLLRAKDGEPFVAGNRVALLTDGGPFFRAVLELIDAAERYLFVESYMFLPDQTGLRVGEALARRARDGLPVFVGYDAFGSFSLSAELLELLGGAGVVFHEFNPISPLRNRWPWSKRNHRKIVLADGQVGIVGGMNFANDYAAIEDGGGGWRDSAVRIEGPAVAQLDAIFRADWARHAKSPLPAPAGPSPVYPGGHEVRFVTNEGRIVRAHIRRAYMRAIASAERSIRITNAYFAPDRVLLRALCRAAKRGVKVEVILAGRTDVGLVLHAARGLYGRQLRAGVTVYEWHERVLHAKTAVIDGNWSTIGSANLNHRTSFKDLEVNATIIGPVIGREMDDRFEIDRARSIRVDLAVWRRRPFSQRALEWFVGLFRRFI